MKTLPLAIFPVAVGAAAALRERVGFDVVSFALSVAAVGSVHVAAIWGSDLVDHRAGTDKLARLDRSAIATGGLPLEDGSLSPRMLGRATIALLACAIAAVVAIGEPEATRSFVIALVLAASYAGPPLRLAYVGYGLGEAVVIACYGPLAVSGAYAAATGWSPPVGVVLASLALGGLIAMAYASHHFLHWRSDRAATKRTIVVTLGERGALVAIGLVDVVAGALLVVSWRVAEVSPVALLGLLGVPVIAAAVSRAWSDPLPQSHLRLIGAHLAAAAFTAIGLTLGFASAGPIA